MRRRRPDRKVGHTAVAGAVLVLAAVAALVAPLPTAAIEAWYSRRFYLHVQRIITPLSNLTPVALLDVAVVLILALGVWRLLHAARSARPLLALSGYAWRSLVFAAAGYLAFLALWGLNYRRIPLERKLDFVAARISPDAALKLATESVRLVNQHHTAAHHATLADAALEAAFAEAQRLLGAPVPAVPGVPKRSLLTYYFRWAAIDGMTDPFFLEVILNADVLPVERPFVLAHEWAHLAGYADESEANFLAWLTCARADEQARYSGWLSLYAHLNGVLARDQRRALAATLAPGPRADLAAIAARLTRSAPAVRRVAHGAYDSYLKANRVERGIRSYDDVIRLVLGVTFEEGWVPRLAQ